MAGCKIEEVPKPRLIGSRLPFQEHHPRGLPISERRASGAPDGRRHRINLILARQAQRHSVSQFRVQTHQTGIIDERLFPDPAAA